MFVVPPDKVNEDSTLCLRAEKGYELAFDRDFVYASRDGRNCRYPMQQVKRIA